MRTVGSARVVLAFGGSGNLHPQPVRHIAA
jgi:hypothetical protein